jgi:hypothetical protein
MREVARNMRAKPRAAILFIEPPGRPWIAGPASMDASFYPNAYLLARILSEKLVLVKRKQQWAPRNA